MFLGSRADIRGTNDPPSESRRSSGALETVVLGDGELALRPVRAASRAEGREREVVIVFGCLLSPTSGRQHNGAECAISINQSVMDFPNLLNDWPQPVLGVDLRSGRIHVLNAAAERLLGRPSAVSQEKRSQEVLPLHCAVDPDRWYAFCRDLLSGNGSGSIRLVLRNAAGKEFAACLEGLALGGARRCDALVFVQPDDSRDRKSVV